MEVSKYVTNVTSIFSIIVKVMPVDSMVKL